jgi:glycosyltransferase involved in cell wall biosynthesis
MPLISIVIPNYNGEKTIFFTLESLKKQVFNDFEVIIIDDGSQDDSVSLIHSLIDGQENYMLIEQPHNRGAASARNAGVKKAKGEFIMFIDSDVIINKDTVSKVSNFFKTHDDADAVVGLPDSQNSFSNWASQHFNLRIHHNYIHLPERIGHLYTTICALKKEAFESVNGFNENMKSEEDPELGFRLSDAGFVIYTDKTLIVNHYKHISFKALLKNDFNRSASRARLMLQRSMTESLVKKNNGFISTPMSQVYATLVIPMLWLSFIVGLFYPPAFIFSLVCLLLFLKFFFNYLYFLVDLKGQVFALTTFLLLLIDMSVVGLGIAYGLLQYSLGKEYGNRKIIT